MTNAIGYATQSTFDLGALAFDQTRISPAERRQATLTVTSRLPAGEAQEVLDMLGLHPGRE